MGTRGLTKVIYNGEPVIAQYGQWDHYPEGQGVNALEFLTDPANVEKIRSNIGKVRDLNDAEIAKVDGTPDWPSSYPHLSRDAGSNILKYVSMADDGLGVIRDVEFENDRLFCEGVVTVDLDNNTFTWSDGGYGRDVRNFTYPLDALPSVEQFLDDTAYKGDDY